MLNFFATNNFLSYLLGVLLAVVNTLNIEKGFYTFIYRSYQV